MASDTHKTAVPLNSKEMAHLEYGLQLALHATTARVTGAQSLANPNTQLQFDNQTQGDLVVTAWVDVATLTAGNTEEDVVKRGFQFGAHAPGRKFVVGDLPSVKDRETHPIQRAIMCKIGVGRSWPVDEEQLGKAVLPEGYKSFYVRKAERRPDPAAVPRAV
ncbi:hypothetical protein CAUPRSCDRAFT_12889 [Caulochytrium protostelioides]|uniref:Uncharacterized protein n=1 Tax=Caulochytrium protostelioides TaxID=1555241 RepID=A0A4P9WW46_9FUNG|nr:hypothetical protein CAUPRSCDRAFT_12889 [Caulochytrium protostelioides]